MQYFVLKEAHLKLLENSCWDWNDCEFGAPSMNPKRPYGNSDVIRDIVSILRPDIVWEEEFVEKQLSQKYLDEIGRIHSELTLALAVIVHTKSFSLGEYEADNYCFNWRKSTRNE